MGILSRMPTTKYKLATEARKWWKRAQKYQGGWSLGRDTLYQMCQNTRHTDVAATVSKLWLIGRSHSAALERTHLRDVRWRTEPYRRAADALRSVRRLDARLDQIRGTGDAYDARQLTMVCSCVEDVANALAETVGQLKLSLASKYLHFHAPEIPIFDRNSYGTYCLLAPRRRGRGESLYQGHVERFLLMRRGLLKTVDGPVNARTIDNFAMYWWY